MATAAFKSTTKRTSPADATVGNGAHRRSRSLSRGSGRFPPPSPEESGEFPTPRGRFVNKVRGSGFPEISLDDIADEFFRSRGEEWLGSNGVSSGSRGRSAARQSGVLGAGGSRRQRSASVARFRHGDSERDMDHAPNTVFQAKSRTTSSGNSDYKPKASNKLRRSMSQKDLFRSHDSCSSNSSTLTDDEAPSACAHADKDEPEKTIRAVYFQKKSEHPTGDGEGGGLYEVMRKEVRHAVEEIRTELQKVMVKAETTTLVNGYGNKLTGSNVIHTIAEIRRSYTSKLEESERRRQDLLAELAVEEQRGQEFSNIVKELLPAPKESAAPDRPLRSGRRNHDKSRISRHLAEEAEKYFEDFLSNVEDTDISSYDGERSDASSTVRAGLKLRDPIVQDILSEAHDYQIQSASSPTETDGVVFPWLQWETSNDCSPSPFKRKAGIVVVSDDTVKLDLLSATRDSNKHYGIKNVSLSPDGLGGCSAASRNIVGGRLGEPESQPGSSHGGRRPRTSSFNMDEYLQLQRNEDLLFERFRRKQRIDSGGLVLCARTLVTEFQSTFLRGLSL